MTNPHVIQLDFTCWCLLVLNKWKNCIAIVYVRGKHGRVYQKFASAQFRSTGPAMTWARDIEPSIEFVKVWDHEL